MAHPSTEAALCILEARKLERSAMPVGVALVGIGSGIAFTDSPALIVFAIIGLFAWTLTLAAAEIHWLAARDYIAEAHDDRGWWAHHSPYDIQECDP